MVKRDCYFKIRMDSARYFSFKQVEQEEEDEVKMSGEKTCFKKYFKVN